MPSLFTENVVGVILAVFLLIVMMMWRSYQQAEAKENMKRLRKGVEKSDKQLAKHLSEKDKMLNDKRNSDKLLAQLIVENAEKDEKIRRYEENERRLIEAHPLEVMKEHINKLPTTEKRHYFLSFADLSAHNTRALAQRFRIEIDGKSREVLINEICAGNEP